MYVTTIISTFFDDSARRIIKVFKTGLRAFTGVETGPFGFDSNPVAGMKAIYCDTNIKGKQVIIGYIKTDQLADVGESRMFSTDQEGELKFYVWCKNDGTLHLGGSADNLIRFAQTKAVIDEIQQDIATLKNAFTTWVIVPSDGGAALKAISASWAGTPLEETIDSAKIDEIKTL